MGKKPLLGLLLVTIFVIVALTESVALSTNSIQNDKDKHDDNDEKLPLGLNPKYNKMLPEIMIPSVKLKTMSTAAAAAAAAAAEKKQTSKIPLADDMRYNKMLPEKNEKNDETKDLNKSKKLNSEDEDDYLYDSDDDDNYDEDSSNESISNNNNNNIANMTALKIDIKPLNTKDIKKDNVLKSLENDDIKSPSKIDDTINTINKNNNNNKNVNKKNDSNADNDDNDNDDDDDIEDEEEVVFSENIPCPRDCVCARNVNSYLVATCSRLDSDVQKFGLDITDLVVSDIGPKYPIILGPGFFLKIGLKHVSSIKISNCTIEHIHPMAFYGLRELFSVNLTNVGLTTISPDTFKNNPRLRLLTISGNDLSQIVENDSPNSKYLFKSSSLEEIDLSNNNLIKLPQTAFDELKNIVYINLAQNNLKSLPEKLFESVETIEELDLSFNAISTLPSNIFNRTALAILHLKYNYITNDLRFGTNDLQQLDLSFCSIKHVTNFMFNKMEGLTNLNLKGNGLIKIQPEAFSTLKNLRSIDLSMNDLEQVSSLLFLKNSELDVIRLNDNPRLSQLPTDGFQSITGGFNVYYFDVSNCAIGALGYNTFSTMRQLTTLKLAWNNINNLDKLLFTSLDRLTELDLSNNLIVKLDDLTFINNRDLTKLNLAGNPIKKLSSKLFIPLKSLRELDVSECELYTLITDHQNNDINNHLKIYETLRTLNVSFNQIKRISINDLERFKSLKTLDISNNPLKCNDDFRNLMKWLSKNDMLSKKIPISMDIKESFMQQISMESAQTWDEITKTVCKHSKDDVFKITHKDDNIDKKIKYENDKKIFNIIKEMKYNNNDRDDIDEDTSIGDDTDDSDDHDDDNDDDDDDDDDVDDDDDNESEYNEDDYEDDSDDDNTNDHDNNNNNNNTTKTNKKDLIKDKGLFVDEINLIHETENKFLRGKLDGNMNDDIDDDDDDIDDDDDDDDNDDDNDNTQELNVNRIYYTDYKFLLPLIISLSTAVVILFIIGKIFTLMMKKRGERYRQALLASKNSIVYQKLSEEIISPPTPKVHRYTPIIRV